MSKQPEALRLADWLLDNVQNMNHADAAAELRRLHALNAELVEALSELTDCGGEAWGEDRPCVRIAREALAKAEGREA